ncbi:MAG: alkaline phosphatase family protein [Vicinamibacterales bacterium]
MTPPPASPGPDPKVDELRSQLRALGYLDARVDRFVIGRAGPTVRPARLVAAASARIGLLAGVLLGPAAAVGLRARAPELVTNGTDAAIAASYLAVLFGVAAALAAGVAIAIGVALARRAVRHPHFPARAARVAGAAGLVVAAACLLYLTLWWRAAATSETGSVVWTTAALAVGVAISLLLGHAVTLTVLAVLTRVGLGRLLRPGLPLSSRRAVVLMAAIALAGAVGLLAATGRERAPAPPPPLTVVPTGGPVVVIAIDGVDTATLERLASAGRLPALARLTSGAVARLTPVEPGDPARVWSTIATGQTPEHHGIRALESREVAGLEGRLPQDAPQPSVVTRVTDLLRLTRPSVASGTERRVPAFWEVAARAGLRTAVVHWWATWPASTPDAGIVLSDRALLRLERGGEQNGEIAPAALYDTLERDWPARREAAEALAAPVVADVTPGAIGDVIHRSAVMDATLASIARDPALGPVDLMAVYLPGLDIAQHALLGGADARAQSPGETAARLAAIERYYVFLDGLVARLAAPGDAAPGATAASPAAEATVTPAAPRTLLVTQPGRVGSPSGGLLAFAGDEASRVHDEVPVTAVAGTVLYAVGVPVADDLAAPPAIDLFSPAFVAAHAVRHVTTYGPRISPPRPAGRPLDREMIERMRSLGYVR